MTNLDKGGWMSESLTLWLQSPRKGAKSQLSTIHYGPKVGTLWFGTIFLEIAAKVKRLSEIKPHLSWTEKSITVTAIAEFGSEIECTSNSKVKCICRQQGCRKQGGGHGAHWQIS